MTNNAWNSPYPDADGELLIGSTGARPVASTLTAGTNVTIVNSAGGAEIQTSPIDDFVVVQRDTASNTAAIDYLCRISDFEVFYLIGNNTQPVTSGGLGIKLSTDGGATFDSTASNFQGVGWEVDDGASTTHLDDSALTAAKLQIYGSTTANAGVDANEVCSFIMTIWNPSDTNWTKCVSYSVYIDNGGQHQTQYWASFHKSTTAINAMRLQQSTGNISQGEFVLYGAS